MTLPIGLSRLAALLAAALVPCVPAWSASCVAPTALTAIGPVLDRAAARLERNEKLTILAIGSSSTQGVGASSAEASYPSRLEAELKARYPNDDIRVINRGIGGEDAPEELARLGREIGGDHPDLAIWQVGTNAVLRRDDLAADDQLIERGVKLLKESEIDVVLMDLQYAPRVLERPAYAEMERLIAEIAHQAHVGLFRRFEIMRHWGSTHQLDPDAMIGGDGLHMTDASYGCLAADLADALAGNWRSRPLVMKPPPRSASGAVAKLDRRNPDANASGQP